MRRVLLIAGVVLACTAAPTATRTSATPGVATQTEVPRSSAPANPAIGGDRADAGIMFVLSAAGQWLRYDGATGRLSDIGGTAAAVQAENADAIYLTGPQGSRTIVRWDGSLDNAFDCGSGGFITFNSAGACATYGSHTGPGPGPFAIYPTPPVYVRLPGDRQARILLPADWGATAAQWSPDSARLAVTRVTPPYPTAPNQFFQGSLWIVEADGSARELYRPAPGNALPLRWSPDGKYLFGWGGGPTEPFSRLQLIDVLSGRLTDLGGSGPYPGWFQWSADGRFAFVRGAENVTWRDKVVVVRDLDGSERILTPPWTGDVVGLAPAWDPAGGRIAWIAARSGDSSEYIDGIGVGDRHAFISDRAGGLVEIRCPGRVVEGVRWSRDGEALLLLCRRPGATTAVFELWLHRLHPQGRPAVEFLTSLDWDRFLDRKGGFAPSLFAFVAWSRAVR